MENRERSSSPEPSCVSMKSDGSMGPPSNISDEAVTSVYEEKQINASAS